MSAIIAMTDRLVVTSGGWAARVWSSQAAVLGFLLLAVFSLCVFAIGYFIPKADWDILAYVASAYQEPGMSAFEVHRHAYETVRHAVSEGDFLMLTEDRQYRIRQYADPDAFMSMLGFYKVKWLYIQSISWLSVFTDPMNALRLISSLSGAAIGGLSIAWLWRYRALHLAPLALSVMMLAGVGYITRVGAPDALSAALFVAGMFAFMRKREMSTAILLFLAFLARPDHIAFFGVLFVVSIFLRSFSWGALAAFVVSAIAYVPITQAAGHPGWWVQMWFTHVEYVGTLEGFHPAFSIAMYFQMLARAVVRSLIEHHWAAVMIIGCAIWWQMIQHHVAMARRETVVLTATVLAILAKFIVFPTHETRFYAAYLVVFGLILVCAAARVRFELPQKQDNAGAENA